MNSSDQFGRWLSRPPPGEEVVISGVSGRFAECHNIQDLKENLFGKKDMITSNNVRWDLEHPEIPKRMGKMPDINKLDAGYFGIHHRQADTMDPSMRKCLETAMEAIMDAGINPSELGGTRTGVFAASCYSDFEPANNTSLVQPQMCGITSYLKSYFAHRISYFLNLKGPSYALDTACSSSLNGLEHAFASIRTGQCDSVLVLGTSLLLRPEMTRAFFSFGVLNPDAVCNVFDESANGFVRTEATVCVLLQKAKNARRIYAQILHSKINDDGFKPAGLNHPSTELQEQLMSQVLQDSGVHPSEISYIEAHGTGTPVGDPVEAGAIDRAIAKKRAKPLLVGSIKSNLGHAEPASGFCGLSKIIIALETGFIPPNIHLKNLNMNIEGLATGRIKVVTETTRLDHDDAIVGINNLGFGGNNVFVLLRRFHKVKSNKGLPKDNLPRLVCVSGRTEDAVSVFLRDVNKRSLDEEYIGLLHQVFKKDIAGHIHRGFTIVSKDGVLKTDVKHFVNKKQLYLVMGTFSQNDNTAVPYLSQFPCFRSITDATHELFTKHRISKIGTDMEYNFFESFALQIAIIESLKLLELNPSVVYVDSLGKLLTAYYYEDIALFDMLDVVCEFALTKSSCKIDDLKNRFTEYIQSIFNSRGYLNLRDILACKQSTRKFQNSIVLNTCAYNLNGAKAISFEDVDDCKFLEIIGRLYEEGYNPQVDKLYPTVEFPVSRNTPMISPLIQWDYSNSWFIYRHQALKTNVIQEQYIVPNHLSEDQDYIKGHVVNGNNLIPAIEYLHLVWRTLSPSEEVLDKPVVFENCKFIKAVTIPKNGVAKLSVSIQKGSGHFEVSEAKSVVVTGQIYFAEDVHKQHIELPKLRLKTDPTELMEKDEIYKELRLRGYQYSGPFQSIVKCNIDADVAIVRWDNIWTTFLDNMLQVKALQMDTRQLYVPTGIKKMMIDPIKHCQFAEANQSLCPVYADRNSNTIRSGGIEIRNVKMAAIFKRKPGRIPVLEKYVFIPNRYRLSVADSLRVIAQTIVENSLLNNFKAVEIQDRSTNNNQVLLPLVSKVLDDIALVVSDLVISSEEDLTEIAGIKVENVVLSSSSDLLLIIARHVFQNSGLLSQALNALNKNGFILTRENVDFIPNNLSDTYQILLEHVVGDEKFVLFRKITPEISSQFLEMTWNSLDWMPRVQDAMKQESSIVIYSHNKEPEGLLGMINCLRLEPGASKVSCFLIMDEDSQFDPCNPFYGEQLRKNLAVNILQHKTWGTYRLMLLGDLPDVESEHCIVNNIATRNISNLSWIQGPLTCETQLKDELLVYPYYTSVNFKDVMIASGRVKVGNIVSERKDQEYPIGIEFCGIDNRGRRVLGVTSTAMATMIAIDEEQAWQMPDNWTMEDGSTIMVAYGTVVYCFFVTNIMKRGMSILIHSATGAVGLAAINVCLYYGCDIYVTVGTEEKRDFLKKHFPQIPSSHIASSRNTSFEEMIKTETRGRGVDIVLNSLAEDKLKASIRCMASGGDFIEIGVFDIERDASMDLLLFDKKITYHGFYLVQSFLKRLDHVKKIKHELDKGVRLGYVKPLPRTVFKKDQIIDAFKYMMTGRHIGKVVVQVRNEDKKPVIPSGTLFKGVLRFFCHSDKTYIIIGGLGGMGLELADWLCFRGAKKLVLVSRSGVKTGYQNQRMRLWKSYGVTVKVYTKDITTRDGCVALIEDSQKIGPVDGIFNLAVLLKDAIFENQNEDTFRSSLAPKAVVTVHLDQVTRKCCPRLRYFVVFSSISCSSGCPGQTNYGMANSIMERLCERRKRDGLPGLAIQWGAIGDVGIVASMQGGNDELTIRGTSLQPISSCMEVMDTFLAQDNPVVSSRVIAEKSNKTYKAKSAVDVVMCSLGIKDLRTIGHHISFAELGLDSMTGTEVMQTLDQDFGIYVSSTEVRSLTFAKLMELEAEISKDGADRNTEKKTNFMLQHSPRQPPANSPTMIRLPSRVQESDQAPTLFLLPGIEGVFEYLEPLTTSIKAHIFAAQYRYENPENSIEECAANLLHCIEEIASRQRSVYVVGFSFGSVVATEIVAALEKKDLTAHLILIDGSPKYLSALVRHNFSLNTEHDLQISLLIKLISYMTAIKFPPSQKDQLSQCQSFDERIDFVLKAVPSFIFTKQDILVFYRRLKAIAGYKFTRDKIRSSVHLFRAKFPMVANFRNDYCLPEICEKSVEVTEVNGDHFSMLTQKVLVDGINNLLSK